MALTVHKALAVGLTGFSLLTATVLQAGDTKRSEQLNLMKRYFEPYPNLYSLESKPSPAENVLGVWVAFTNDDFQSVIAFHTADENLGRWHVLSRQPNQLYMQQRNRELLIMLSRQEGKTRVKYRYLNFDC